MEKSCREIARKAIEESIPKENWNENWLFINNLRSEISKHKIFSHPIVKSLYNKEFPKEKMKNVFLNFRPFVSKFTDVLLKSALLTYQVDTNLQEGSKMHGRFLITLNLLDELGFSPDVDSKNYYQGTPYNSHFLLFEKVLQQAGISKKEKDEFVPSNAGQEIINIWEGEDNLLTLAAILASGEMIVLHFSPALRKNAEVFEQLDLNSGYFYVHGSSEDEDTDAADDDHEDDLWYLIAQTLTLEQQDTVKNKIFNHLDLWVEFWNSQLAIN